MQRGVLLWNLWSTLLWCLQAGQRRPLGWGSAGPLVGRLCNCLRLPVRVLEQEPAGAVPPGDRQRLALDVREVLRPRLGIPVPAQPPAHQLCGPADRQSGLHDTRLVVALETSVVPITAKDIFCMNILALNISSFQSCRRNCAYYLFFSRQSRRNPLWFISGSEQSRNRLLVNMSVLFKQTCMSCQLTSAFCGQITFSQHTCGISLLRPSAPMLVWRDDILQKATCSCGIHLV